MLHQEGFVAGGGHLGGEQRMVIVLVGFAPVGPQVVHGVPHLMRYRGHMVQRTVIVHQHVGMRGIGPPGVTAGTFALRLINIHPARAQAFLELVEILLAQRREPLQHQGRAFLPGVFPGFFLHQRGVQVVGVELIHPQDLLAQRHPLMKRLQDGVCGRYQVPENAHRNIVAVETGFKAGGIFPGHGQEVIFFHRGRKAGRYRVDVLHIRFVVHLGGVAAHPAVRAFQDGAVPLLGELYILAVLILDGAERHVGVLDHAEDVRRSGQHRACTRQQGLFLIRKDVRLGPDQVFQHKGVGFKLRVGGRISHQRGAVHCQQLRLDKGRGVAQFGIDIRSLALHFLVLAHPVVLVQL